jgi:replicative DNA helicase
MISLSALEEAILSLLGFSTEHAPLLALKIEDPQFFTSRTNQKIAQTCLDHIRTYMAPPKGQLEYLLEGEMTRGEEGKYLRDQLTTITKKSSEIDPNFIIQQLDTFLEIRKLTQSLQKSLQYAEEGELEKAKETIFQASFTNHKNGTGLWMKDPQQALSFLDPEIHTDYFSSGIPILDLKNVRPEKKTLFVLIASAKKGKTFFLVNVGKAGLQFHHKVLHVTLELSDEKTALRYLQAIFGLTKEEIKQVRVPFFHRDDLGNLSIQFSELQRESVFSKRKEIQKRIENWHSCPDWVIKQFPTSTLTVEGLYLYLNSLKQERGFQPDLLVIDYPDLMKLDAATLRLDTGRLYRELRGLAVSENLALVGASQGNREGESAKLVTVRHVAEDWSKIGTADIILTYSQTPEEEKLRLARLFTAAVRETEGHYIVLISQCYPIGVFCLDSVLMNPDLANEVQGLSNQ